MWQFSKHNTMRLMNIRQLLYYYSRKKVLFLCAYHKLKAHISVSYNLQRA